jgi:hypothetical protein
MSKEFDWISDVSERWDQMDPTGAPALAKQTSAPAARTERILVGLTLLAILILLVAVANWGVGGAIQEVVLRTEAEAIATHQVTQSAVLSSDLELFSSLLSHQDLQWHNIQRVLMRRRLIHDRAPLGLWLDAKMLAALEDSPDSPAASVALSPNLELAEITTVLPYVTQQDDGTLKNIWLRRSEFYRQVGQQWFLVPSDSTDYWGEQEITEGGEILTVTYPHRDRDIVLRLAQDIDQVLRQLCQDAALLSCSQGAKLHITLGTDPASLLKLNNFIRRPEYLNWRALDRTRRQVDTELPAPSLVGYPLDEPAYQALFSGYAAWAATIFIYNQSQPQPLPFDQVVKLLSGVGLSPPPPGGYNPFWAREAAPISFPDQEIELSCTQEPEDRQLWRYDPRADTWSPVAELAECQEGDCGSGEEEALTGTAPEQPQEMAATAIAASIPDSEMLLDSLPVFYKPAELRIEDVAVDPNEPGHLFILARSAANLHNVYLYSYDLSSTQLSYIDRWQDNGYNGLPTLVSKNGRFLTITRFSSFNTYISIYDVEQRARRAMQITGRPNSPSDWSDDERWLVIAAERMLWLVAPEFDYARTIQHNIAGCQSAVWVEPA